MNKERTEIESKTNTWTKESTKTTTTTKMMKLFSAHTYKVYTEAHYLSLKHVNGEQYLLKRQLKNDFLIIYLSFRILLQAINKLNEADIYSTILLCCIDGSCSRCSCFQLGWEEERPKGRERENGKGLISVLPNDAFVLYIYLFIFSCFHMQLNFYCRKTKSVRQWKDESRRIGWNEETTTNSYYLDAIFTCAYARGRCKRVLFTYFPEYEHIQISWKRSNMNLHRVFVCLIATAVMFTHLLECQALCHCWTSKSARARSNAKNHSHLVE